MRNHIRKEDIQKFFDDISKYAMAVFVIVIEILLMWWILH